MLKSLLKGGSTTVKLSRDSNQALELGKFAIDFLKNGKPSPKVIERVKLFHTDSVICGVSALALKTNAPTVLRDEALQLSKESAGTRARPGYARVFGSLNNCFVEKAIAANVSAVREWDSNGTVFGFNDKIPGHQAGEFGHNDFYPVVIAASNQNSKINGAKAARAMILIDEIRGRLAEVFSLKTYKIDHVVHGAIASAATYGALMGATPEQIEHAIGMFVAHYIPFRAIRAGKQLSDSKGASAAISTEAAILCVKRALAGFIGPKDIFRNPEAIFRLNQPTQGDSPFDIVLSTQGDDFSVMGMHFKLGLYEHQSAGAIEAILNLIYKNDFLQKGQHDNIANIKIVAYEPAFGIIGDPAKKSPKTRQSADHSMVYIISTLLTKALQDPAGVRQRHNNLDGVWKELILTPHDYGAKALFDPTTRALMEKITFEHGGPEYDKRYPDGIPTSVLITLKSGETFDSGLVMYPSGHARNTTADLKDILRNKFNVLGRLAMEQRELDKFLERLENLENLSGADLHQLYNGTINYHAKSIDEN